MGIIAFLILGLIAGAIAKALMPGDDRGGFFLTMLLGVVGAFLGGWLGSMLLGTDVMDEFFDLSTWASAIVGSLVVLGIYRAVAGRDDDRVHGV
ncbi:MAG: sle [Thermoleophilia bacterium]|nr:sle [Thermoleophilia bacterium]